MAVDIEKVKGWLRAAFAWVNTESAFVMALIAGCWGFTYKAGHADAPYGELIAFIIALCSGFFWSRRKKQALTIGAPLGLKIEAKPAGEPNGEAK